MNLRDNFTRTDIKVLVTAGPTYEAIDPVRFIGNHSSGKMGYAIADSFARRGAEVTVVSGPVSVEPSERNVKVVNTVSAAEMYEACAARIAKVDVAVFAAAVADYTPGAPSGHKIKKGEGNLEISLVPTRDIAAEMGKHKKEEQFYVGFALETENALENARSKLQRKRLDLIVLNSLQDEGAGFGTDTNLVTLIDKSGNIDKFDLKLKSELAEDIVERILKMTEDA